MSTPGPLTVTTDARLYTTTTTIANNNTNTDTDTNTTRPTIAIINVNILIGIVADVVFLQHVYASICIQASGLRYIPCNTVHRIDPVMMLSNQYA